MEAGLSDGGLEEFVDCVGKRVQDKRVIDNGMTEAVVAC